MDQQTRHALKHDQFVDTTQHGLEWASENRRSIIVTSAIVLAVIVVVVVGALIYNHRADQASIAFGEAMQAYQTPLAHLSVRISERLRWNAGYQYYGYHEEFGVLSAIQNYRAHTGYTSLLWAF